MPADICTVSVISFLAFVERGVFYRDFTQIYEEPLKGGQGLNLQFLHLVIVSKHSNERAQK